MDYWRGMGTAWLLDVNFQLVPQMSRGQASGEGWRYVTLQSDRLLTNWTLLWILCQTDFWCPLISSWSTLMTWKVSSADETSCFLSLPVCIGAKVNLLLQANITVKFKVCVDLTVHHDHRWPGGCDHWRRTSTSGEVAANVAGFDTGAACHVENTLGLLHFLFR